MDHVPIKGEAETLRREILSIEKDVRRLMFHDSLMAEQRFEEQHSEMKANIMLAVRHLEDARMRLGKLIQHSVSGVSIYDS